jgi:hypothetical protein
MVWILSLWNLWEEPYDEIIVFPIDLIRISANRISFHIFRSYWQPLSFCGFNSCQSYELERLGCSSKEADIDLA